MSEILAHIHVRETTGIRRFLYPLTASVTFPSFVDPFAYGLASSDGMAVPMQLTPESDYFWRLDFAVSMPPLTELDLFLTPHQTPQMVDDPLHVTDYGDHGSVQKCFALNYWLHATVFSVVYDSIPYLRSRGTISLNGMEAQSRGGTMFPDGTYLSAWASANGQYEDGRAAQTHLEITACKSWATVMHTLEQPKPGDEVVFILPLAITSPTLTCDFGVGGYVFGKLDEKAAEIVWHTEFGEAPYARWTVATAGRVDYVGEVTTAEEFLPQRWFHLIDSDKALAVAITVLPGDCRELTVRLTRDGDVSVTFKLGEAVAKHPEEHIEVGVCYHFLNDVPAIAAATNPQSILMPPVVEVLPV